MAGLTESPSMLPRAGYGNGGLANSATSCDVERRTHVAEAVIGNRNLAEAIAESVGELEKRLTPVTRNEPSQPKGQDQSKVAARAPRVDLADAIESNSALLDQSFLRLRGILERLEL